MKIGKAKLRSIIQEELARVLKEENDYQARQKKEDNKLAQMAAPRAV